MTITSLVAVVSFLDLGNGNGLIGAIAEIQGRNDPIPRIKRQF